MDKALSTKPPPRVSIVVPAFNEAAHIGDSVRMIERFLGRLPYETELLVVDDGSRDETARIVESLHVPGLRLIRNSENRGKGHAVTTGVLAATGDYVLFSDADLSAPIEELEKLLSVAVAENVDVVVGSRAIDRSFIEKHQSLIREVGGIFFNRMVRLLLGLKIHDTQCGFKLFKREKIVPVFQKLTTFGFGFDPELLFLAKVARLTIQEVPCAGAMRKARRFDFSATASTCSAISFEFAGITSSASTRNRPVSMAVGRSSRIMSAGATVQP
jgi:glycosyltransferase involved in cell wall biosynthesis